MLHPLPCAYMPSLYPDGDDRPGFVSRSLAVPVAGSLPREFGGAASALTVSRPARRSLALRPAHSLSRPRRPYFTAQPPSRHEVILSAMARMHSTQRSGATRLTGTGTQLHSSVDPFP